MADVVHWLQEPPDLRDPILVTALEGFIDAGSAAETAATFLRHRWQSDVVAVLDRDAFLDYRARRPTAVVDAGELRRLSVPAIELCVATVEGARDVVLLVGHEPDMGWDAFTQTMVEVCKRLGVTASLALGAYPAAAPHTRPIRLTKARTSGPEGLAVHAAPVPGYTGPVGAATALQHALGEAGIPATGIWAEVPHYISASPNPAAALALVHAVVGALGVEMETGELEAAAKLHREQVDEAVAEHEEAAAMIRAFEEHVDSGGGELDIPSGEDLADEIERFLRTESE